MFRLFRAVLAIAVIGLAAVQAPALAVAQENASPRITAADRAEILARAAALATAFKTGDAATTVAGIPPRIIDLIAADFGMTPDEARAATRAAMAATFADVTIVEYRIELDGAEVAVTPDGSRAYLAAPLVMEIDVMGSRFAATSYVVALKDDGVWYLVDVGEPPQAEMLRRVYPEFAGVDFPAGSVAVLD